MPRELKHFGCAFKCGKTGSQRKRIVEHEKVCFSNPATKSCKTCVLFFRGEPMEWDTGHFVMAHCEHEDGPGNFEGDDAAKLRTNCELHERK